MHFQIGHPSLGGWLAVINCLFWLGVAWFGPTWKANSGLASFEVVLLLFMSLPIAWPLMLPSLHYTPTYSSVVLTCLVIALNAFLWGYTLSWIVKRSHRRLSG